MNMLMFDMDTKTLHQSWGKAIRKRRSDLGFTQERFAELCDVEQSTVSRIERGDQPPSDRLKYVIAGVLQVSVEVLFAYPAVVPPFPSKEEVA